jgi:hypothetical protein
MFSFGRRPDKGLGCSIGVADDDKKTSGTNSFLSRIIAIIGVFTLLLIITASPDQTQAAILGDLNGNNRVDLEDFEVMAYYWNEANCADYNNCDGADFAPTDGRVDESDLTVFSNQWLDIMPVEVNAVFYSMADKDGRFWDHNDGIGFGHNSGDSSSSALAIGDYAAGPGQLHVGYRALVAFDTSSALPDDCNIVNAQIELVRGTAEGNDPFNWGADCVIDIAKPFFGAGSDLDKSDWQASADGNNIATFLFDPGADLPMLSTGFNSEGLDIIDTNGQSQFKIYFQNSTNYDDTSDTLGFYSGEAEIAKRPKLKITYQSRRPKVLFESTPAEDGRLYAKYDFIEWTANGAVSDDSGDTALALGDYENGLDNLFSYRNILSFDTSSLPDDCTIIAAKLQITRSGKGGDDPFTWAGTCNIDLANPYFGVDADLDIDDWDAAADAEEIAQFLADPGDELPMVSTEFSIDGINNINKTGNTQFRIYFDTESDLDGGTDRLNFYAADYAAFEKRPKLIIQYTP